MQTQIQTQNQKNKESYLQQKTKQQNQAQNALQNVQNNQDQQKVEYQDQTTKKQTQYDGKNQKYQPLQNYQIKKTLGEGNFGKVKLAIHKLTNQFVAVKILEKDLIFQQTDIVRISRELKIMKKLRHPYVVQLYEIIETPKELYLIMEYAEQGDLFDKIIRDQRIPQQQAAQIYAQIALGMQYMHSKGISHRDLKPQNILISKNGIKIADFGLGNTFKHGQKLKTACGSPCYAPPQMLNKQLYDPQKIDIWSSGIILYAMVCGYLPFQDPVTSKLYEKIKNTNFKLPSSISNPCRNLIRGLLTKDPTMRYQMQTILSHSFILQKVLKFNQQMLQNQLSSKQRIQQVAEKFGIVQKQKLMSDLSKNRHNQLTTLYYLGLKGLKQTTSCKQQQSAQMCQQQQDTQINAPQIQIEQQNKPCQMEAQFRNVKPTQSVNMIEQNPTSVQQPLTQDSQLKKDIEIEDQYNPRQQLQNNLQQIDKSQNLRDQQYQNRSQHYQQPQSYQNLGILDNEEKNQIQQEEQSKLKVQQSNNIINKLQDNQIIQQNSSQILDKNTDKDEQMIQQRVNSLKIEKEYANQTQANKDSQTVQDQTKEITDNKQINHKFNEIEGLKKQNDPHQTESLLDFKTEKPELSMIQNSQDQNIERTHSKDQCQIENAQNIAFNKGNELKQLKQQGQKTKSEVVQLGIKQQTNQSGIKQQTNQSVIKQQRNQSVIHIAQNNLVQQNINKAISLQQNESEQKLNYKIRTKSGNYAQEIQSSAELNRRNSNSSLSKKQSNNQKSSNAVQKTIKKNSKIDEAVHLNHDKRKQSQTTKNIETVSTPQKSNRIIKKEPLPEIKQKKQVLNISARQKQLEKKQLIQINKNKSSKAQTKIQYSNQRLRRNNERLQYKPQSLNNEQINLKDIKLYERSHSKDRPLVLKKNFNKPAPSNFVTNNNKSNISKKQSIQERKDLNMSMKTQKNISKNAQLNLNSSSQNFKNGITKLKNQQKDRMNQTNRSSYSVQNNNIKKKFSVIQNNNFNKQPLSRSVTVIGKQCSVSEPSVIDPSKIVLTSGDRLCQILSKKGFVGKIQYFTYLQEDYIFLLRSSLKISTKFIQKSQKPELKSIIKQINRTTKV